MISHLGCGGRGGVLSWKAGRRRIWLFPGDLRLWVCRGVGAREAAPLSMAGTTSKRPGPPLITGLSGLLEPEVHSHSDCIQYVVWIQRCCPNNETAPGETRC